MKKPRGKINILFCITHVPYIGGAEIATLNTIKHLNKNKFSAKVLLPRESRFAALLRSNGIHTQIIPMFRRWERFRERLTSYVHMHNIHLMHLINMRCFEFNSALVAKMAGIPVIWHMHFRFDAAFPKMGKTKRKALLSLMHSLASKIVGCSRYSAAQFTEVGLKKNVVALPNGVDVKMLECSIDKSRRLFRGAYGIQKDEFLVGMVSRITPQKRPFDFIRTAARMKRRYPAVKFILVGSDTTKEYWARIQKASAEKVILTGFYERTPEVMHALDVLLFPAIKDTAGLVILEAMACKKPVVAADSGGVREIIVPRKTGIVVPPKQPAAFAQAIIQLLQNPQKARELGEQGYLRVKKHFEIRASVRKIEALYQQVLAERKVIPRGKAFPYL